jgi:drug/metabolite transporter (DMT)-like permease
MPVFSTLLAILFLGEVLRPFHFAGIALIGAGIYLTTSARPPKADPPKGVIRSR